MFEVFRSTTVVLIAGIVLAPGFATAQTPVLDSLLAVAEASWPDLAARRADLAAATARATEADRAYRPDLSVGGTYTLAAGGRVIALPLGDLLNPAYATLNQLTETDAFPRLENTEEQFLPNNFYDARLRVRQPLYRPEIAIGRERAREGVAAADAQAAVTAADLREAVRTAYFQWLSARTGVEVYTASLSLLDEAYRTTAALVRNGAALPLARERIVAERAGISAERVAAEARVANARAQLNSLLGNDLGAALPAPRAGVGGTEVELDPMDLTDSDSGSDSISVGFASRSSQGRNFERFDSLGGAQVLPELIALRAAVRLAALDAELEWQWRRPRLGLQVDAGSQDFDFGLQPYALAGLSLEIPLYDGNRHSARAQRIAAERDAAERRVASAERALDLRETVARNDLAAAEAALTAYAPAVAAAERAERDASRLYRAGATGYVELLDAQQQLTRTRLERNLAEYAVYLAFARLLRALGR